jgi:hypothetical protein
MLPGVNQTIADAMSTVLARPLLMAVPLLLDLVLWLGWQFSARPLSSWLAREVDNAGGPDSSLVRDEVLAFGERARVNDLLAAGVPSIFGGLPRDSVVSLLISLFAPMVTRGVDRGKMFDSWGDGLLTTFTPANGFGVVGLGMLFLIVATVIAVVFRVPQARLLRGEPLAGHQLASDLAEAWWRLVLLIGLMIGGGAAVLLPVSFGLAVLYLAGINLVALLVIALLLFGGMIAIYTFFAIDAIVLNRAGPLQAISLSMVVVRNNFAMTFRFVAVTVLIGTGVLHVWDTLIGNPPGIAIALLGNAFLGTVLSLASMQFYQDRYRQLDPNLIRKALTGGLRFIR